MALTWIYSCMFVVTVLICTTDAKPLTLSRAITVAVENNRALIAQQKKIAAAEKRIHQAGRLPNPEIIAGVEGIRADEVEVTVSHTFEPAKKRNARIQATAAETVPLKTEYEMLRIELAANVTRSFVTMLSLREKIVMMDSLILSAETVQHAIQERFDAGAATRVDLLRASQSVAGLRNSKNALLRSEQRTGLTLKEQLGDISPEPLSVTGTLRHDLPPPDRAFCAARIRQHPALKIYDSKLSLDTARLQMATAQRLPDVTVTAGYLRDNERHENKPVIEAGLALPLFNRNRAEMEAITEERLSVEAQKYQVLLSRTTSAEQLLLHISECDAKIAVIRDEMLPTGKTIYEELIAMYTSGRVSFIEVTEAQTDLLNLRTTLIDLQFERLLFFVDLEEQCGTTFSLLQ